MDYKNKEPNYLFDFRLLTTTEFEETANENITFLDDTNKFHLRPLCSTDYERGYLKLLSQLTVTGNVTQQMYSDTFDLMKSSPGIYYIIIIEDTETDHIVASGSLILEKKFIHSCGQRGRIEDIVVDSNYRGKRFGKIIVQRLVDLSRTLNCYKISLECKDNNVTWYSSMGFIREVGNSNYMQIRL